MSELIVITGQIGAGKSTLTEALRNASATVLDADVMAGIAVNENRFSISKIIEVEVGFMTPAVRRQAIADVIFKQPEKKQEVEDLLFPIIHSMFLSARMMFESLGMETLFYDAPLVFESGFIVKMKPDHVIIVDAEVDVRRKRVMESRGYTAEDFDRRNASQMTTNEKLKLWPAAIVLDNNGPQEEFVLRLKPVLDKIFP